MRTGDRVRLKVSDHWETGTLTEHVRGTVLDVWWVRVDSLPDADISFYEHELDPL